MHIVARTLDGSVSCPDCGLPSDRVHSCYERRLADTPVGDQPVLIELTARRLYCDNERCGRRMFVEQVGGADVPLWETVICFAPAPGGRGRRARRSGGSPADRGPAQCGQSDDAAEAADGAS
ncbi:transposase family protein [Streptomyces sp. NPDC006514]|uniref:transposase family protein n=1 Tax=Streptomyces sp. NPDC006514 TaxID=3154308 RepID=UPI0033BF2FB7